jgi:hypothetical protein
MSGMTKISWYDCAAAELGRDWLAEHDAWQGTLHPFLLPMLIKRDMN